MKRKEKFLAMIYFVQYSHWSGMITGQLKEGANPVHKSVPFYTFSFKYRITDLYVNRAIYKLQFHTYPTHLKWKFGAY